MTYETKSGLNNNSELVLGGIRSKGMLRCLKVATLTLAIMMALCIKANSQQLLSAEEIESQIIGHRFQGKKGILSVSLHYARDGTVTMQSPIGAGAGNWRLSDNQLCVKLSSGPRKANECMTFISQQDGTYRASNGLRLTVVK